MSSTRIKNLQSTSPLIVKHFSEMEFMMGVNSRFYPQAYRQGVKGGDWAEASHSSNRRGRYATGRVGEKLDIAGVTITGDLYGLNVG